MALSMSLPTSFREIKDLRPRASTPDHLMQLADKLAAATRDIDELAEELKAHWSDVESNEKAKIRTVAYLLIEPPTWQDRLRGALRYWLGGIRLARLLEGGAASESALSRYLEAREEFREARDRFVDFALTRLETEDAEYQRALEVPANDIIASRNLEPSMTPEEFRAWLTRRPDSAS